MNTLMLNGHHIMSPSQLGRRALCPGSARMELAAGLLGINPKHSGEAAEEGRRLHAVIAGKESPDGLEPDQIELVERCQKYAEALAPKSATIRTEVPLTLEDEDGPITRGEADWMAVDESAKTIYVVDWKVGRNATPEVSAVLQLAGYGAAALQSFGREGWRVAVRLYHPRLKVDYAAEWEGSREPLAAIRAVIARASDPDAALRPSFDGCRFCKGLAVCPGVWREVLSLQAAEFTLAEDLGAALDLRGRLDKWSDAVRNAAVQYMKNGGEIPGRRLVPMPGRRRVTDPAGAFKAVAPVLDQPTFLQAVDVRISELEALYSTARAKDGMVTKKAAVAELAGLLDPFIERGEGYDKIEKER